MSSHDVTVKQLRTYPVWSPQGEKTVWMNVDGDQMGRLAVYGTSYDERVWLLQKDHQWMIVAFVTEEWEREFLKERGDEWPIKQRITAPVAARSPHA